MLTLEPADIIHLDFVLHTRTAILHEVIQNDKLPIVAAPNILSDIVLSILGLPVFNASNKKLTVQPGTLLFSLAFTKVHSILAIHDDEPKIVRKTLQEKNILNSVLLQTLSSLMSRLATTLDMEERIQAAEALQSISVQTSESENYQPMSSSDGQLTVTSTPASQLSVMKAGTQHRKSRIKTQKSDGHFPLKKDLPDKALESIFLIQSLTNKNFGLKKEDLRSMQLHDSFLESKIRTIETSRKPDPKFKLVNGILYHSPPDTNQNVLVSHVPSANP